jgi:hypothetical protein
VSETLVEARGLVLVDEELMDRYEYVGGPWKFVKEYPFQQGS